MNWQIASFAVLMVVLAAGFAWYERSRPPAKVLSLVAALAALATVGRIAFAPIPNVKPTTDIALFAGYALGPVPGFAVGAVAALASNVFFGQGPWTPWQMVGWGGAGLLGGLVAWAFGRDMGRWRLAAFCALAGALFGMLMDGYQWVQGAGQDLDHYLAISATSLPYNVAHVVGNIGFCLLLGPTFVKALSRYRRRFSVHWAVSASAALIAAVSLAAPQTAEATSPSARAVAFLRSAQNSDGGFGGARGQSSTGLHTGWVALGFAGAGVNPGDVVRGGNSIVDYLRSRAGSLNDIGELERTVLALDSAGVSARSFAGHDLVAAIEHKRSRNGSWKGNNGWTAFGVLALKATGGSGVGRSAHWLARQQNRDGGFGF
ncbi:MAG: energy-coupling factor transport system substrate-specific component, partial [Thermoleophilaceae bacterium]|nr:energy-coupling factor transport system substrate-specific component [Thermoleophilaceae bacterium]